MFGLLFRPWFAELAFFDLGFGFYAEKTTPEPDPEVWSRKLNPTFKKTIQIDMLSSFIKSDTELVENKHSGKYISNLNFGP